MRAGSVVTVKPADPDNPPPVELIAEAIVAISQGVRELRKSRLTGKALLLLIQHAIPTSGRPPTRPTQRDIQAVLDALEDLERIYLKPKGKP
jgi:hypothetical protein